MFFSVGVLLHVRTAKQTKAQEEPEERNDMKPTSGLQPIPTVLSCSRQSSSDRIRDHRTAVPLVRPPPA